MGRKQIIIIKNKDIVDILSYYLREKGNK